MNHPELAEEIAARTLVTLPAVRRVLDALTEIVAEELRAGGRVQIMNLGTWWAKPLPRKAEPCALHGGKVFARKATQRAMWRAAMTMRLAVGHRAQVKRRLTPI